MGRPSKHLKALHRRLDFLDTRIEEIEVSRADWHGLDFYKAERAALVWALSVLEPGPEDYTGSQ